MNGDLPSSDPRTRSVNAVVGEHPVFRKALAHIAVASGSDATVLLTGETGTGKELAAHAIHYGSSRRAGPFVAVNCGALQDSLLENELFGHDRGAFTDARESKPGLIALGHRGTLFFDEVGTLSSRGQITLLRVLQERTFRPIGAAREQSADVRFIAATNVPLSQLVDGNKFRSDLYYRLCVFTIELPPLRDRRDDIVLIAERLLRQHAPDDRKFRLTDAAAAALTAHGWPGNVRELENVLVRAMLLAAGDVLDVADLAPLPPAPGPAACRSQAPVKSFNLAKLEVIRAFERQYLTSALHEHDGNISRAARAIGKERRDLARLLKKHELDPNAFRRGSGTVASKPHLG